MLYFDILKNRRVEMSRNLTRDKETFARILIFLSIAFWAAYLLFLGAMLPSLFIAEWPGMEPYHMLNKGLALILFVDFIIRFTFPTPAQEIRPYLLLPVSRRKTMACFLLHRIFQPFNLFWMFFFIPFALLTITQFYGFSGVTGYLLGIWMLMVMNSYWSMLICVLKRQRFIYILFSCFVYLPLILAEVLPHTQYTSTAFMYLAEGFILCKVWAFAIVIALIALLFYLNYRIQMASVYKEISSNDSYRAGRIKVFAFLENIGGIGEYMLLEVKQISRNKRPRTRFWSAIFVTCLFIAALTADLYQENYMQQFVCLYCFCILGVMSLPQIMSTEGNYIDGLMVHKESIYHMLCAKYYIQCLLLILPFSLCMIAVGLEKIPLLMSVAYMAFTMGIVFCGLMQMAVYNNTTSPLNAGAIVKKRENTTWQSVTVLAALFVPLLICKILIFCFNEDTAYVLFIILGIAGFATHRLWIHNIYTRMMKRRYKNMEGFRSSK